MAEYKERKFCEYCNKPVLATKPAPNHILHFLISALTCGAWVIPWAIDHHMKLRGGKFTCPQCGSQNLMDGPPAGAKRD